jgi:hypothetical protein
MKLFRLESWSHRSGLACRFRMDCKVVVRIQVSASLLGLGTGSDMTRHNRIQRNPTRRPR